MKIETLSTAAHGINARIPAISIALLIPAYRPGPALIEVVRSLAGAGFAGIIVVDDGSGRGFAGEVPLRSRLGNSITRAMMRLVVGQRLSDTQTGLRAIPRELVERM